MLVTEGRAKDSFLRGDAVEVLQASPHRVEPPCAYAGPAATRPGCGGCDLQHVELGHQRELKAAVVREQLRRLAGLDVDVVVEALPGTPEQERGLRWRTRVELAVDEVGRAGLRQHRSHDVVPLDDCLIADERVVATGALSTVWTGCTGVDVVAADEPAAAVEVPLPVDGRCRSSASTWRSRPRRVPGRSPSASPPAASGRSTRPPRRRSSPTSSPSSTRSRGSAPSTSTPGSGSSPRRSPTRWA